MQKANLKFDICNFNFTIFPSLMFSVPLWLQVGHNRTQGRIAIRPCYCRLYVRARRGVPRPSLCQSLIKPAARQNRVDIEGGAASMYKRDSRDDSGCGCIHVRGMSRTAQPSTQLTDQYTITFGLFVRQISNNNHVSESKLSICRLLIRLLPQLHFDFNA